MDTDTDAGDIAMALLHSSADVLKMVSQEEVQSELQVDMNVRVDEKP